MFKYSIYPVAFYYIIPLAVIFCVLLYFKFKISIIFLILILFVGYFFRKPNLDLNYDPSNLYCPAWGKITSIEDIPELKGYKKISIFLSVFDVHLQCVPIDSEVQKVEYVKGQFLNAMNQDSSHLNEKNTLTLKINKTSELIQVSQIAGLIARRIICFVKAPDKLIAKRFFGLIQFGSRVEITVPPSMDICVSKGDRVNGPNTTLAKFKK